MWLPRSIFERDLLSVLRFDVPKTPLEIMHELDNLWANNRVRVRFLFWSWTPTASLGRTYATLGNFEDKGWVVAQKRVLSADQLAMRGNRGVREWRLTRGGVEERRRREVSAELKRIRSSASWRPA